MIDASSKAISINVVPSPFPLISKLTEKVLSQRVVESLVSGNNPIVPTILLRLLFLSVGVLLVVVAVLDKAAVEVKAIQILAFAKTCREKKLREIILQILNLMLSFSRTMTCFFEMIFNMEC